MSQSNPGEEQPLPTGRIIERELTLGEEHRYTVKLTKGQVLQVRVDEQGVVSVLSLRDIRERRSVALIVSTSGYSHQILTFIADRSDTYLLVVEAQGLLLRGTYSLSALIKNRANKADEERVRAERLMMECFLAWNQRQVSEYETLITVLEGTLRTWTHLGALHAEGFTNNLLGLICNDLGEHQRALPYFQRAAALYRAVDDKHGETSALNNTGAMCLRLGLRKGAVAYLKRSVQNCREVGDKRGEAATLTNICAMLMVSGELREALEHYERALTLSREIGDRNLEGTTLNSMGVVYSDLGMNQKALTLYYLAMLHFNAVGSKMEQLTCFNNLGKTLIDAGQYQEALEKLNHALLLSQEVKNRQQEGALENMLGSVHWHLDDNEKSLLHLMRALKLRREVGDVRGEAITLNNIGTLYLEMKNEPEGLKYIQQSLPLSVVIGNKRGAATALANLASGMNQLGKPRLAVFYHKLAVILLQELRGDVRSLDKEVQRTFLRSIEKNFRLLTERLIEQGRLSEAHQILNRFKDQTFFDYSLKGLDGTAFADEAGEIQLTPLEAAAHSKYQEALQRSHDLTLRLIELELQGQHRPPDAHEGGATEQVGVESKRLVEEFRELMDRIAADFECSVVSEQDAIALTTDSVEMHLTLRELNARAGQKAVGLYTLLGEKHLRLLLVTEDGLIAKSVPSPNSELAKKVLAFWNLLSRSAAHDPRPPARDLYDLIFAPVADEVRRAGANTLLWSLDGELRYVPMAALFDGQQYLAERFRNVIFTRARRSRMTRPVSHRWTGWGFGSSKAHRLDDKLYAALPGVEAELREIFQVAEDDSGIITGTVLLDDDFTKQALTEALSRKRPLVHIASHFNFSPGDETGSFLLLGDGDRLTLHEMKEHGQMFDGVELLTLSACKTAAQQADSAGREVDGFAELAQRLGADAVLASLWAVRDSSTAELMIDFYHKRERLGWSKAEALRSAQRAMIRGAQTSTDEAETGVRDVELYGAGTVAPDQSTPALKYAHPHYWAPFVLFGNWQ